MTSVFSADSIESPGFKSSAAGVEVAAIKQGDIPIRQISQILSSRTMANPSLATVPFDNTIPQITEGTEVFSITITPKKIGSLLRIATDCIIGNGSGGAWNSVSIFKDTDVNAAVTTPSYGLTATALYPGNALLDYTTVSLTPIKFSVRCGAHTGTGYLNAASATTSQGGVVSSGMSITEYLP